MVAIFLPVDMYHAVLYISPYMRLVDFVFGIFLALGYFSLRGKPAKRFTNSALSQFIIICLIVLLVVESCVYENARCFSVIYWPLIALLILIASLSETSSGGQIHGKQLLATIRRFEFCDIPYTSTGVTLC